MNTTLKIALPLMLVMLVGCQKPVEPSDNSPQAVASAPIDAAPVADTHDNHDNEHEHDDKDHHDDHDHAGHNHAVVEGGAPFDCTPEAHLTLALHNHEGERELHVYQDNVQYDLSVVEGQQDAFVTEDGFDDKPVAVVLRSDGADIYEYIKNSAPNSGKLLYSCKGSLPKVEGGA